MQPLPAVRSLWNCEVEGMISLTINGKRVTVPEGTTILEAARTSGVAIPTLCYLKGVNEVGACRMCVVEVKGADRLVAACDTFVAEGMEVETNTDRVRAARKSNLQLILSGHDCHCLTCERNGNCQLQGLAHEMNLDGELPYPAKVPKDSWNTALPFVRKASRCISCLRCMSVCDKIQGMRVWDLVGLGRFARVGVRNGLTLQEAHCTFCGQCVVHCPVAALGERDDGERFLAAVRDPSKTVVLQVAPAVRASWGEDLGLPRAVATERRMVAAFRALGADFVFDTDFAADLTVMEEGNELVERLRSGEKGPLFTSCCPAWVRFLKQEYPDMAGCLSSAKSPQQMFGAIAKTFFAQKVNRDPKDVFCVSVMPCTAKKREAEEGTGDRGSGIRDVDLVLTTREAVCLMRRQGIGVEGLSERDFDSPLGTGSGAGVLFGATGGVMEAALRTAAFVLEGKNPDPERFRSVRGSDGRREVTVEIGGQTIRACVASGLRNARQVVEDVRNGLADYDFVEVMACPGGCAGGGGQPFSDECERATLRGKVLYGLDEANKVRFSHENPEVLKLYDEFLGRPLSSRARELLHVQNLSSQPY